MPETTPLIKAALNLRVGAGFDVYDNTGLAISINNCFLSKFFFFMLCYSYVDYCKMHSFYSYNQSITKNYRSIYIIRI